jgi:hypothetical protein
LLSLARGPFSRLARPEQPRSEETQTVFDKLVELVVAFDRISEGLQAERAR